MKERSDSGYWSKGQHYVPPEGPCKGHTVEVMNPEVDLVQTVQVTEGEHKGKIAKMVLPSVLVRCTECFKSWSFAEATRMPVDDDE